MIRKVSLVLILLFIFKSAKSQVEGFVFDATNNEPLPGATINLKNKQLVTITNNDGFYNISASNNDTLVFSFLGYKTYEVVVGGDKKIVVSLQENRQKLNEIVVVGYGVQRRKELTGAISTVNRAHLEYNVSPTVDALMSGAVAGVNVSQSSGQPGAPSSIRIRGGNSINADNNPLYVIDGFLIYSNSTSRKTGFTSIEGESNPLDLLNPSDIESIEVLKDVSATAIYGSRGSNGVILITTKKGKKNGYSIDYKYTAGISNSSKKLNLLNAEQWAKIQKDYFLNKPGYSDEQILNLGDGYDWQNAVLQTGMTNNHSLSISSGNEQIQYIVSLNYLNQEGIILNSGFERFNGRLGLRNKLSDKLSIGLDISSTTSTQNSLTTFEGVSYNSSPYSKGIANSLTYALYIPPVVPFKNKSGDNFNYNNPFEYAYLREGNKTANPISDLLNSTAQTNNNVLLGNLNAQYSPIKELIVKFSIGNNISNTIQKFYSPSYTALGLEPDGIGGKGHKLSNILLTELTLTYSRHINDKHAFDVLVGTTYEKTRTNYDGMQSAGFTNESLGADNLQDGLPYGKRPVFSGSSQNKLYSILGRVNYSLYDKYHLTANFRSDYSTNFAANYKWGYFPSIGLSWNINEENYFKYNLPAINIIKLRASAGSVGNQEIDSYLYLKTLEAGHYGNQTVYGIGNIGNDNLKWETTSQYNLGLDIAFFNSRFSFTTDIYYKKTSDLLLEIPPTIGQEKSQMVNVGNVVNKGIEFSLNNTLIDNSKTRWNLSANIAKNLNKITRLTDDGRDIYPNSNEILRVGESIGSFYGLVFDGVVQTSEDVSLLPTTPSYTQPQPGDPKFKDVIKDNHIDKNDRVVLGSRQPDFTYGISNSIKYENFDLFFLFQGSQGNKVYNQLRRYLESAGDAYNSSAVLLDSWTEDKPSGTIPRITNVPLSSELDSRYIEDASYLRLKTLTIGYSLDKRLLPSLKLNIRLFATVQNLFTITGYKGYDPEIAGGIDLGTYPMSRTVLFGTNISF